MRRLTVHNFGPVKDAVIDIHKINILIGEQSIGKSTLAKLITIFTDRMSLFKLIVHPRDNWSDLIKDYDLNYCLRFKYSIIFEEETKDYSLKIKIGEQNIEHSFKTSGQEITDTNVIHEVLLNDKSVDHGSFNELSHDFFNMNVFDNLKENLRDSLYIPAERIIYSVIGNIQSALMLSKASVPNNLLRFMVDLQNAEKTYDECEIPMLGVTYVRENNENRIKIKQSKKSLSLTEVSSGIQSVFPLYIVSKYALEKREYSSYVIEEPECNLFPTKQVELLKFLLNSISKENMILTITTHSPYLLSALSNYFFAGSIVRDFGDEAKKEIEKVSPGTPLLSSDTCSVYSLGKEINGKEYCKSLVDEETQSIDINVLDGISLDMSNEFEKFENIYLKYAKDND